MLKKLVIIFFAATSVLQATENKDYEDLKPVSETKHRNPIQVVVFPFRIENGKVEYLLMHRIPKRDGVWQGVSGGVEDNEDLNKAAARELREETGFVAKVESINFQFEYPVKKEFSHIYLPNVKNIKEHSFTADVTGLGEPILSDEHDAFQWVPFDKIDTYDLQWEGSKKGIIKANEHIITRLNRSRKLK